MNDDNSSQKKGISEYYQTAVHIIFAVIIANTFELAGDVITQFDTIFENSSGWVWAFSVFFVYFIIVTSWIGYARSINNIGYKDNSMGVARFSIDLIILFEIFYLTSIVDIGTFSKEFHVVMMIIFITYFFWDMIKYLECRHSNDADESRIGKTTIFLAIIFTIVAGYNHIQEEGLVDMLGGSDSTTLIFILAFIIATVSYRQWKWNPKKKK